MKVKEFRIPLHMSVDEYQIAQNWSVNEQSRRETGGGEGVEIRENKPFTGMSFLDGKYTSGQYTYKIYKVETKLPKFLRYDLSFDRKININIADVFETISIIQTTIIFNIQNHFSNRYGQRWIGSTRRSLECISIL